VILNHNDRQFLNNCLKTVLASNYPNLEVILVDNASTDGSVELVKREFGDSPRLKIILNSKNLGFAKGNNIGAKAAKGKYIFFLNSDTKVDRNCLKELVRVMEVHPEIGAAQPKIYLMDKEKCFDAAGHYINFLGLGIPKGRGERDRGQIDHMSEVFPLGAAFIIRRNLFREMGGFDPDYFIYFEETDLFWRMQLRGYGSVFVHRALVHHKWGATTFSWPQSRKVYLTWKNRITTLLKNYSLINLAKFLPVCILSALLLSLLYFWKGRKENGEAIIRAIIENLLHLKETIQKRRKAQKMRRVEDEFLMQKGLIVRPDFLRLFKRKFLES
jgi:hypothetical protein